MYTPNLETDYQQYLLDCAGDKDYARIVPLSFQEWLAARTRKRIEMDREPIAMLRKQAD